MRASLSRLLLILLLISPTIAMAKDVAIEWGTIEDAVQYELSVEKVSGKESVSVVTKTLEKTSWSGDLPEGLYQYRIRGLDFVKRPGEWSEYKALAVMPAKPPEIKSVASKVPGKEGVPSELNWTSAPGVASYEVEILESGKSVKKIIVKGTEFKPGDLPPGKYTVHVRPVFEAGTSAPDSMKGKQWTGPAAKLSEFTVKAPEPEKPQEVERPKEQTKEAAKEEPKEKSPEQTAEKPKESEQPSVASQTKHFSLGLLTGLNLSVPSDSNNTAYVPDLAYALGLSFEFAPTAKFSLEADLLYAQRKYEAPRNGISNLQPVSATEHAVEIPLLAKYHPWKFLSFGGGLYALHYIGGITMAFGGSGLLTTSVAQMNTVSRDAIQRTWWDLGGVVEVGAIVPFSRRLSGSFDTRFTGSFLNNTSMSGFGLRFFDTQFLLGLCFSFGGGN